MHIKWTVAVLVLLAALLGAVARADGVDDAHADAAANDGAAADAERLAVGTRVFHRKCIKCHGSGREGAPDIERPDEWAARLEQPMPVLVEHALNGHQGDRGRMPPKGGFASLSDAEVEAAVAYMVRRGRWLVERAEKLRVACAERDAESAGCAPAPSGDSVLLRLLWMLTEARGAR